MNREAALYYQGLMKETVEKFQETNKQIATLISQRQKLIASESENQMVEAEFKLIDDDDETPIYKLVGPVLVKQDLEEAKQNVKNRLNYFKQERDRLDKQQKDLESQRNKHQEKILSIQETVKKLQKEAVAAATKQTPQATAQTV